MDSKQAASILISPLTAPQPSEETGLNASLRRSPASPRFLPSSKNPFRDPANRNSMGNDDAFTHVRHTSRGSSIASPSSPHTSQFPNYREHALAPLNDGHVKCRSIDDPPAYNEASYSGRPRRSSSLRERFPGDTSHRPLDIIRRDSKKAQRASHLKKYHIPGADTIDRLDMTSNNNMAYHHEGPFDAALLARNVDVKASPVAALENSNREALRATAPENIKDALDRHRPLDGFAALPPGMPDRLGRRLDYEEGENELIEGDQAGSPHGWGGVVYHKNDARGQGEPFFSLDRALQAHTIHEREFDGHRGIELSNRSKDRKSRDAQDPVAIVGDEGRYSDLQYAADTDAHRLPHRKGSIKAGLKKRIGSLKHKGLDDWLP